jgi:ankyrin repeat protein
MDEIFSYDEEQYCTLAQSLGIKTNYWHDMMEYAIKTLDMDLITYIISRYNFTNPVSHLMSKPIYYPILETIIENNKEYFTDEFSEPSMYYILSLSDIPKNNNIQLLNLIITHIPLDNIITPLISSAIDTNNLVVIDIIHQANFNIEAGFDKYLSEFDDYQSYEFVNFKHDTCIFLQDYGIDLCAARLTILPEYQEYGINLCTRLEFLSKLFCETDNIPGVEFCVDIGADPTNIMKNRKYPPRLSMTKCLINCGVDLTQLDEEYIKRFIDYNIDDITSIAYLIDSGLDISTYIRELMYLVVSKDYVNTFIYLIKLGYDIHYDNEYLLFYGAHNGHSKCVKILLENGADINARTKSILSYNAIPTRWKKQSIIDKILIEHGAITHNYHSILCRYIASLRDIPLDKGYFIYLLELGIDLNSKFNDDYYIFEAIIIFGPSELIKICVEYGADPHINNCRSLLFAIRGKKIESIRILLELGLLISIINLKNTVMPEIISLLDQYHVPYSFC